MEVAQEKVFKSNLEEAMTYDYVSILKSALRDFLRKRLELSILDIIAEVEKRS